MNEADVRMNLKRYLQAHGWWVEHIPDFMPVAGIGGGAGNRDSDLHSKPDLIAFTLHENKKLFIEVKKADINATKSGFSCSFNCKDIRPKQRLFLDNRYQEGWNPMLAIGSIPGSTNGKRPKRGFFFVPWHVWLRYERSKFDDLDAHGTTIRWEMMQDELARYEWKWLGIGGDYEFEPKDKNQKGWLENNNPFRRPFDQYQELSLRRKQQ